MGAIQNFKVSFGLVTFNAGLWKASEPKGAKISCKRLHKHATADEKTGEVTGESYHETGQKIYCKECKTDLNSDQVTSGYEYEKGRFVEVTDQDKDSLKVEGTGTIQIDQVISKKFLLDRPYMLDGFYYLTPQLSERTTEAYAVMLEALGDRAAIGHCVMYSKTRPLAIIAGEGCFHVYTLMFKGEIRQPQVPVLPKTEKSYVKMGKQLLEALATDEPSLDYPDEYRQGWDQMISDKLKGVKKEETVAEKPTLKVSSTEDMFKAALAEIEADKKKKPARKKAS